MSLLFFAVGIMSHTSDGNTPHIMHYLYTCCISVILPAINIVLIYIFGILIFFAKKIHPLPQYSKVRASGLSEFALTCRY